MSLKVLRYAAYVAAATVFAPPALAITIDDISAPGYVTGNSAYTGVARILFSDTAMTGTFICSGALVSSFHVLTAGHCVDDALDWEVTFETPSGTTSLAVADGDVHPLYGPRPAPLDAISEYDLALLTLAVAAPLDAEIYGLNPFLAGLTTASVVDLVGYGLGGNPFVGHLGTGVRRHATNTVDGLLGSLNGVPTPDNPLFMQYNFSPTPGSTLGLINGGDSGGPMLFNGEIVGVASFGNLPRPPSAFGDFTYFTGHASLFHDSTISWLQGHLAPVPEPGTVVLVSLGLVAVAVRYRRSRPRN